MPKYDIIGSGETVRRKNLFLACGMEERINDATPQERAAMFREGFWCDYITQAEWEVVLGHGGSSATRSKLKKKLAAWIMALHHVAELRGLNNDIYRSAVEKAKQMRTTQYGDELPWLSILPAIVGLREVEPGEGLRVIRFQSDEDDD